MGQNTVQTVVSSGRANGKPSRPRRRRWQFTLSAMVMVVVVCAILFGSLRAAKRVAKQKAQARAQCAQNLKQLLAAMHNYHTANGCFPPAYIADPTGQPMHSWRVLLLPHLGETALYNAYNFAEPWNGPHNSNLATSMPSVYVCPADRGSLTTSYVAVVGAGTLWPGDQPVSIMQVRDGTANTVALLEVAKSGIHWLEPRDLPSPSAIVTGRHQLLGMADGAVLPLPSVLKAGPLQALLTTDGGEVINW